MTSHLSEALPPWVSWFGPVLGLTTLLMVAMTVWGISIARPMKGFERIEPWTERARRVYVARSASQASILILPAVGVLSAVAFVGQAASIGSTTMSLVLAVVALLCGVWFVGRVDQRIHGQTDSLTDSVSSALIGYGPVLALLTLGWFAPDRLWNWWMVPWLVGALLIVRAWLHLPLVLRRVGLVEPAGPRVTTIAERVAHEVGVDLRHVLELPARQPNALAFPWLRTVMFTRGLIAELDDAELEAITHHEFAHLSESTGLTRLRQAQVYAFVPLAAMRPLFGSLGLVGPLAAVVLLVGVIEVARRRGLAAERDSDLVALEAVHHSPAYGRALEKTHRIGLIPAVLRRSTHGPLHERLTAAGVQPEFDLPRPPSAKRVMVLVPAILLIFAIALLSPWLAAAVLDDGSVIPMQMAAAIPLYGTDALETLALQAEVDGRWFDAAVLFEAVLRTTPDNELARGEVLRAWASAGECDRVESAAAALGIEESGPYRDYVNDLIEWCLRSWVG